MILLSVGIAIGAAIGAAVGVLYERAHWKGIYSRAMEPTILEDGPLRPTDSPSEP